MELNALKKVETLPDDTIGQKLLTETTYDYDETDYGK
jgi:hypothetical protein